MIDYSDGDAFDAFSMFADVNDSFEPMFDIVAGFDTSAYGDLPPPRYEEADAASVFLPGADAELDRTASVLHLLKAYGEASSPELARVILARLREKASPTGAAAERLAHHLLPQRSDPQAELLAAESGRSYALALQAFYEMTPYGRLAHFVANAAVHESVPRDAASVRIVDFDVGEGLQWPPLLAALGPRRSVRVTCVDADEGCCRFARTKERLLAFARTMRLDLRVDAARMEELLVEKKEYLVFNCMVGLPHMGTTNKTRKQLLDFTKIARERIIGSGRRGVLVHGSGGGGGDESPFADARLLRSHAMFESMEWHFPSASNLSLARTAMECLFVGPACAGGCGAVGAGDVGGLEGVSVGWSGSTEAVEIVRRGGGGEEYGLRIGDGDGIVLEWRGTPLVRVCAWR